MMPVPKIISFGEVLWDLFPDGERFGGAPANFACHAALLGGDVTMVSAVGDEKRGRKAIGILGGFGIDTNQVRVIPRTTTGSVGVEVDAAGKPKFTIHENAAWDQVAWSSELESAISGADAVYFGTLGQRSEVSRATIRRALALARSAGKMRILDVNLRAPFFDDNLIRDSVEGVSHLKLSDDELEAVAGACGISLDGAPADVLCQLRSRFRLHSVVMTRGAQGALFVSEEDVIDQPGVPAEVLDTVGAGDAFTAAFVLGILKGEKLEAVLRQACEKAAVVCSQPGAVPAGPQTLVQP